MSITRRTLLSTAIPALSLLTYNLRAHAADNTVPASFSAPRTLGDPKAAVHIEEWFSLTCTHCARFAQTVFPEIQKQYIDTGKVFYTFKDFPLDKVALAASIVARSLPKDQYKPFVFLLLDNLDQWAFKEGVDPMQELQKYSVLAGMPPDEFQRVTHDMNLREVILREIDYAQKHYNIDSTPTFIFNGKPVVGELTIEDFGKHVTAAQSSVYKK